MELKVKYVYPVKFISFQLPWGKSPVTHFFDCKGSHAQQYLHIGERCRFAEAYERHHHRFYKITDLVNARPAGFIISFYFYVQTERDAHVSFHKSATHADTEFGYEFGNKKTTHFYPVQNDRNFYLSLQYLAVRSVERGIR